jgi:RNA polymerase sigma-70 factor (ECF subfamily)
VTHEEIEREVRTLCAAGDVAGGASVAIRGYGREVFGLLVTQHRTESDADEVFATWSERVLRHLGSFQWDCTLRTWVYTIARHASASYLRDRGVEARRNVPLADSSAPVPEALQAAARTETRPYLRTTAKSKLAEIRDALPPEDRALLVLRLDRGLEWKELARIMLGAEGGLDEDTLRRESQRLRKRFQLLKERLVEAGRRHGLVGEPEEP